jgi:hypothetical protein
MILMWGSGIGLGVRYLRAGRSIERADANDLDDPTKELVVDFEQKILVEGQREVASGTLSMSAPETDGKLSLAADAGRLSDVEDQ